AFACLHECCGMPPLRSVNPLTTPGEELFESFDDLANLCENAAQWLRRARSIIEPASPGPETAPAPAVEQLAHVVVRHEGGQRSGPACLMEGSNGVRHSAASWGGLRRARRERAPLAPDVRGFLRRHGPVRARRLFPRCQCRGPENAALQRSGAQKTHRN